MDIINYFEGFNLSINKHSTIAILEHIDKHLTIIINKSTFRINGTNAWCYDIDIELITKIIRIQKQYIFNNKIPNCLQCKQNLINEEIIFPKGNTYIYCPNCKFQNIIRNE